MKIEYHNLYCHFIIVTYQRLPTISEENRSRVEKYITGIVNNLGSKLYAIYANPEHVHILVSRSPAVSEEKLATAIADSSQKFINENKLCKGHFAWQQSASAFSVSKSDLKRLCEYIERQPLHHRKVSFKDEYDSLIKFYHKGLRTETRSEP